MMTAYGTVRLSPSVAPSGRNRVAVWALAAITALAVATTEFGTDGGTILCPFRRCTGVVCPGCGFTRATGSLLRGDIESAHAHHVLVVPLLLQLSAGLVLWTTTTSGFWTRHRRLILALLAVDVVAMLAVWALRLLA